MALITEGLLTAVLDGINWQLSIFCSRAAKSLFFFTPGGPQSYMVNTNGIKYRPLHITECPKILSQAVETLLSLSFSYLKSYGFIHV